MPDGATRSRRKFLRYFRGGFRDETYMEWERGYKWLAHERWEKELHRAEFQTLLRQGDFIEIARRATRIESRTNLLFSFEKMAVRDAVRSTVGARAFAHGLFELLHAPGKLDRKFTRWCAVLESLPRRQTRVLTWPVATVFGFIAQPKVHVFVKPNVTRAAAQAYGFDFEYVSRPNWPTYESALEFTAVLRRDLRELRPRDLIDVQSFMWVLGSDEYPD